MRYVSPFWGLKLFRKNGEIAHEFRNGVLVVGDMTTINGTNVTRGTESLGYVVDAFAYASAPETEIFITSKDLSGKALGDSGFNRWEGTGLGTLDKKTNAGATLTTIQEGYAENRIYFEAPALTSSATLVVGATYEVLVGPVSYNGVAYKPGQTFKVVDGTTAIVGAGKVGLSASVLRNNENTFISEEFKIKLLQQGDESTGYWYPDVQGAFDPRNSLTSSDVGFYGWTR